MLWIALHLPRLPLEALAGLSAAHAPPGIVMERGAGGLVVLLANEAAAALGIQPGMGLAGSRSRCAGLMVAAREPSAEARLLEQLALAALRYTPRVIVAPDGLVLEVQASLRLFGGERRLWASLQADVGTWGLSMGWAAAPTCEAARLLALVNGQRTLQTSQTSQAPPRTRQPQRAAAWLDALPLPLVLNAWAAPASMQALFQGLGVRTLGEWRQMPREGLERRGAADLLKRLDRAYGLLPEPQVFHVAPERFEQSLDMPEHTDRVDLILLALQRLMLALGGWLAVRHRAAQVLSLRLVHDSPRREVHPDTYLTCRLFAAEADPAALLGLMREQLNRQTLPAPVRRLVLQLDAHGERQAQSGALKWAPTFDGGQIEPIDEEAPLRLVDQLRARLGPHSVLTLSTQADHRPERASVWRPSNEPLAHPPSPHHPASSRQAAAPHPLPRPCWLLPQPQPLTERQGQLWHGSTRFVLRSRPERIEAGWFDDEPTCRDYHIASGPQGRLAWVFKDHRGPEPAWFLHGWFG